MKNIKYFSNHSEVNEYMHTYTFHPELDRFREAHVQQKALTALLQNDVTLCIAVEDNIIVGYTLILQPEENERWGYLDYIKVLGVLEVAPAYRGKGLAKRLLQGVCAHSWVERYIILSLEYAWHWDLKMVNGDIELYKKLLKEVLEFAGFREMITDEPNIAMYKHNFLMARSGSEITSDQINNFMRLANQDSIF